MGTFQERLGINEIKSKNNPIWKALLAEFLGNLMLNIFACGACAFSGGEYLLTALAFGVTIFILVQTLGHVSGGHFNPAVTAGMMIIGNTPLIKGILYIIVQSIGAITGSAILYGLTSSNDGMHKTLLGATKLNDVVFSEWEGFGVELFLGFVLVLTVCGVCDPNKPEAKSIAAFAIGMSISCGHLLGLRVTGAGMNPARSFGVAVVMNVWKDHWIYWVGPILGGVIAAPLYKFAFAAPSLGPLKIIERYTTVVTDEKELKRLDGRLDDNVP